MSEPFPLSFQPPEAFSRVREFLASSGYTRQFLLDRFEVPSMHLLLYPTKPPEEMLRRCQGDALLLLLAKLLLAGFTAARGEAEREIPAPVLEAMFALGLLRRAAAGAIYAPVIVFESHGFYMVSDRSRQGDGPGYDGADYVMAGAEDVSRVFVDSFPQSPCGAFLEIGTGSGMGALVASRCSHHVWATDINERAILYTRFNCLLNQASNVTALVGDMYEPVAGMRFDRIASHPPFEPPLKKSMIYSVGAGDGEGLIAKVVAGAHDHLNPSGRLYCLVMGTDREKENFHERAERWLGEKAGDCDLALFVVQTMRPDEYALDHIRGGNVDPGMLSIWESFYHRLEASSVIFGHLVIERRAEPRTVFRIRRDMGAMSASPEMEWLLAREREALLPGFEKRLLESRLETGPGWELQVRHRMSGGELAPVDYRFLCQYPFPLEMSCASWIARLVSGVNGQRTGGEIFESLRGKTETPVDRYVAVMSALISAGIVHIEGCAPPRTGLCETA
jgi:methylase of polypeptide subunit release factors